MRPGVHKMEACQRCKNLKKDKRQPVKVEITASEVQSKQKKNTGLILRKWLCIQMYIHREQKE